MHKRHARGDVMILSTTWLENLISSCVTENTQSRVTWLNHYSFKETASMKKHIQYEAWWWILSIYLSRGRSLCTGTGTERWYIYLARTYVHGNYNNIVGRVRREEISGIIAVAAWENPWWNDVWEGTMINDHDWLRWSGSGANKKRAIFRCSNVSGVGGSSYDGSIKQLAFLPNSKQQHARVASSVRYCRCAVSTAAIATIMAVRRTTVAIISQGGISSSSILSILHLRHRWRRLLHIVVCQVTCRTLNQRKLEVEESYMDEFNSDYIRSRYPWPIWIQQLIWGGKNCERSEHCTKKQVKNYINFTSLQLIVASSSWLVHFFLCERHNIRDRCDDRQQLDKSFCCEDVVLLWRRSHSICHTHCISSSLTHDTIQSHHHCNIIGGGGW